MKEENESSTYIVKDFKIAKIFLVPKNLKFIAAFIGQERSIKELSQALDSNISTTFRRVQKYSELGLIKIVREEKRNGRAIKYYRAVADRFYIPHNLTTGIEDYGLVWHELWGKSILSGFSEAYGNNIDDWGQLIYRQDGILNANLVLGPNVKLNMLEPNSPALFSRLNDAIYLNFEDAKALQRELISIFKKYQSKEGGQRYMMQINLVPITKDTDVLPL